MSTRQDLNNLESFLGKIYEQSFPAEEYPALIARALAMPLLDTVVWELHLLAARGGKVFGYRPPYNLTRHRDQRSIDVGHLALTVRNDCVLVFVIQTYNGGLEFTYLREPQRLMLSNWFEVRESLDPRHAEMFKADVGAYGEIATLEAFRNFMQYAGPAAPATHYHQAGLAKLAADHGVSASLLKQFIDQVRTSNPKPG